MKPLFRLIIEELAKRPEDAEVRNAWSCLRNYLTSKDTQRLHKAAQWLFGINPPTGWQIVSDKNGMWSYHQSEL